MVDPVGRKAYWSEKVRLQDGTSKAGYRNCRTTSLTMTRVRTGVTEIGLKLEQSLGEGVFAIGEMIACFHWSGTKDEAMVPALRIHQVPARSLKCLPDPTRYLAVSKILTLLQCTEC